MSSIISPKKDPADTAGSKRGASQEEEEVSKAPARYIDAMATVATRGKQPHWLNLEYLATEDWADDCHGLTSMHPANGLRKQFYFPGFSPRTGGLLCEANLLNERDTWQADPQQRATLLQRLGVEWDTSTNQRDPHADLAVCLPEPGRSRFVTDTQHEHKSRALPGA